MMSGPTRMCGRPLECKVLLLDLLSGATAVMCPVYRLRFLGHRIEPYAAFAAG